MSQSSVVDDVTSWSQETCRQRLDETLPELLAQYGNGAPTTKKVGILKAMVTSLLPVLDSSQTEELFFATVMPRTRSLFGGICSTILSMIQETSKEKSQERYQSLHQYLQLLIDIINSLELCIQQILPSGGETVAMETIESLPSNVLAVIQRTFSHCKESHTIYGDHFSAVSEPLSALFKRAYSLQKALMTLLEALGNAEQHVHAVSKVCTGFHELCDIISGMDTTLLVSTWRFLVKLVSKHKDIIQNTFEAAPLVISLCSEVESHYRHALQLAPRPPGEGGGSQGGGSQGGDEKAFARILKVCSLCSKMLHHMVKEYGGECVEHCGPRLLEVVLTLQSLTPSNLEAAPISETAHSDLQRSVLVGIEPLLQLILPSRKFCVALLASNKDFQNGQCLARLMTLVSILKLLPSATDDVRTQWLAPVIFPEDEPRDDVMTGIFKVVKLCYVELNVPIRLPGIACKGKPQCDVSLHHHVVTHLCSFVAAVPARLFYVVERCLLQNVLSQDWSGILLAMDVWCFMARYGSADLCANHVRFLFDLLTSLPTNHSPAYIHLGLLLRRMIPLMASENQAELMAAFPPDQHLEVWSCVPLGSLPDSTRELLSEKIVETCMKRLSDWTAESSTNRSEETAVQLVTSIHCVQQLYAQCETNPPITVSLTESLGTTVANLYAALGLDEAGPHLFCHLLDLSGHLLKQLKPVWILKLLKTASAAIMEDSPLTVRLACVGFLRRLAKRTLPPCPEQIAILRHIPQLYGKVLSDRNFLVHQHSLEAFSTFAEETSHESVVPDCMRDEQIQSRVVDYLNQIPAHSNLVSERSEVSWLRDQLEVAKSKTRSCESQPGSIGETFSSVDSCSSLDEEPHSKRPRTDYEDGYREAMSKLKDALDKLKELKWQTSSISVWCQKDLLSARQIIDELVSM